MFTGTREDCRCVWAENDGEEKPNGNPYIFYRKYSNSIFQENDGPIDQQDEEDGDVDEPVQILGSFRSK